MQSESATELEKIIKASIRDAPSSTQTAQLPFQCIFSCAPFFLSFGSCLLSLFPLHLLTISLSLTQCHGLLPQKLSQSQWESFTPAPSWPAETSSAGATTSTGSWGPAIDWTGWPQRLWRGSVQVCGESAFSKGKGKHFRILKKHDTFLLLCQVFSPLLWEYTVPAPCWRAAASTAGATTSTGSWGLAIQRTAWPRRLWGGSVQVGRGGVEKQQQIAQWKKIT